MNNLPIAWYIDNKLFHSLHTSMRMSFRGCRRRWNWIANEGYYPLVTPKPLEFGVAFHRAMEAFYDPRTWHDRETAAALACAAFTSVCKEQYQAYLKLNKGGVNPEAKADYDERILLGLGMLKYYTKWVSPVEDANFTPVKVEIEFEVPIESPDGELLWCKCTRCFRRWMASETGQAEFADKPWASQGEYYEAWKGLPVTYGGRIDMLAQDEQGRYWIYDWKTAARLAGARSDDNQYQSDEFMLLEDQITSYLWALWKLGIPVVGFVYAQIKKAVPEEPEPLKQQRVGRWYSVNKQINTTYEMYYRTVSENDPFAFSQGLYDDFLEYLKGPDGPKYHVRHQVHRSPTELANAGYYIWQEACDMLDPNLRIYPSPGRFACGNCAYREPCLEVNKGEDFQYTLDTLFEKREKHYYEMSTDSRGGR